MEEQLSQQPKIALPAARADKGLAFLFALAIPLHGLHSPAAWISVGEILLLILCFLALWSVQWRRFRLCRPQMMMSVLFTVFVLITISLMLSRGEYHFSAIVIRLIRWGFYVFSAVLLAAVIDFSELRRMVIALSAIAAAMLLIQFVSYALFGKVLMLRIGGTVLGAAREGVYRNGVLQRRIWRFSAFFSEPAHFSYYCNLGLAFLVFYRKELQFEKRELVTIGLIALSILLCSSTYGIALLVLQVTWLFWRYLFYRGRNPIWALLLIAAIILVMVVFSRTQLSEYLYYKMRTITQRERFRFAWQFLHEQRPNERLFGVGVGNEEHYFHISGNSDDVYLNSVSLTYLYCGWVGLGIVAAYFLYELLADAKGKPLLMLMFLLISIFSTAFYSPIMVLITVAFTLGRDMSVWTDRRQGGAVP